MHIKKVLRVTFSFLLLPLHTNSVSKYFLCDLFLFFEGRGYGEQDVVATH